MLLALSWAATSAWMTTKGNFDDMSLVNAKLFPKLSVRPWRRISPADPAGQASPNAVVQTRVANSSNDAMVRQGSPLANAQGALDVLRSTANYLALEGLAPARHSQPPIRTHWPSALASARKAMPRSCVVARISSMRPGPKNSVSNSFRMKTTDQGS